MTKITDPDKGMDDALLEFADTHRRTLCRLFGRETPDLQPMDLVLLMRHSIGPKIKEYYTQHGRLEGCVLEDLMKVSPTDRFAESFCKAIAKAEVAEAMNKTVSGALDSLPEHGTVLGHYIERYRKQRMRKDMLALSMTSTQIDFSTSRLLKSLEEYKASPTFVNKYRVKAHMSAVNKSLLKAHTQARTGAVWALRVGFSEVAVAKAFHRLYVSKMKRLATSMAKLDTYIQRQGIKSTISAGIIRRHKILTREMYAVIASRNKDQTKNAEAPGVKAYIQEIAYG